MTRYAIVLMGCLVGCASSGAPAPEHEPTRDLLTDARGQTIRTASDAGVASTMPAGIDAAYASLGVAYLRFGIDLATRDDAGHALGNSNLPIRGTLHGKPLSRYFNCGTDATGQSLADSRQMTIYVMSSMTAIDPSQTRVRTLVRGQAMSAATSDHSVYCATTGALERELLVEANK